MNPPNLGVIITNATARKVIYSIYILIGFALGGIQAWYGAAAPEWLPQYLAVYGYIGLGVSGLAIANVNTTSAPDLSQTQADYVPEDDTPVADEATPEATPTQ